MEYTTGSRKGTLEALEKEIIALDQMEKVHTDSLVYDMFMAINALVRGEDASPYIEKYIGFLHDPDTDKKEREIIQSMSSIEMTKKFSKTDLINMARHMGVDVSYRDAKFIIAERMKRELEK